METEEKTKMPPNGGYPMHTFEDLEDVFNVYISNKDDRQMIRKAYEFALRVHKGQKRKSGEDYIHHLIEVAYILAKLQAGPATICSGLLHDTVEDTPTEIEDIEREFNPDVARIVDSLTKIQRLKLSHKTESDFEAEDHRKIFLGMAKDIRVIIIKLADRLHNLRTLDALSPERQHAIARETLDVFAPIAHRLGIYTIQSQLEDLSLKYLEPEKYYEIKELLDKKVFNRTKSLDALKKRIADIIFQSNIPFEMESRVKSIYSIYKKMYVKHHNFEDIYDILAIRIITKTEINCYEILGLIHATYKPIPGRFKDYIAVPKRNLYQSLHTSILSGDGNIFEVQIRTKDMDEVAETGIAAHWKYKEGSNYNPAKEQKEIEEKLYWFRDFVNQSQQNSTEDAKEYMDNLQKDVFEANVYVFTPKGKVVDLPNGATPLDFAYRIHTKVGDSAVGAIVNGQLVPLHTVLKTGDVVEIRTSASSAGPNEGWLEFVATANAKNNIKKFLLKKNADLLRDEKIKQGKQSCIDAFKDRGIDENEMLDLLKQRKVFDAYEVDNLDDLFVNIANRNPMPGAIISFLNIKKKVVLNLTKKSTYDANDHNPVYVANAGSIAITLGNCCSPIPGDDIVGYITKGKGITVHRKCCPNIQNAKNRLIEVFWKDNLQLETYPVDIAIEAGDRQSLLTDIMNLFSTNKITCSSISAKFHPNTMTSTVAATINVSDAKRLNDIFNMLLNVSGVYKVERVIH